MLQNCNLKIVQIFPFVFATVTFLEAYAFFLFIVKALKNIDLKEYFPRRGKLSDKVKQLVLFPCSGSSQHLYCPLGFLILQQFVRVKNRTLVITMYKTWILCNHQKSIKKCFHYWKRFDNIKLLNIKTKKNFTVWAGSFNF